MNLKGKVAMVTGAGGGVGKATTQRLASRGKQGGFGGKREKRTNKGDLLRSTDGRNLLPITADITREAEVLNAVEQTILSIR